MRKIHFSRFNSSPLVFVRIAVKALGFRTTSRNNVSQPRMHMRIGAEKTCQRARERTAERKRESATEVEERRRTGGEAEVYADLFSLLSVSLANRRGIVNVTSLIGHSIELYGTLVPPSRGRISGMLI